MMTDAERMTRLRALCTDLCEWCRVGNEPFVYDGYQDPEPGMSFIHELGDVFKSHDCKAQFARFLLREIGERSRKQQGKPKDLDDYIIEKLGRELEDVAARNRELEERLGVSLQDNVASLKAATYWKDSYDKERAVALDLANEVTKWRDKYNREVLGLNNEGDPIGGDQPMGLKQRVERLKRELAVANDTIANQASSVRSAEVMLSEAQALRTEEVKRLEAENNKSVETINELKRGRAEAMERYNAALKELQIARASLDTIRVSVASAGRAMTNYDSYITSLWTQVLRPIIAMTNYDSSETQA